MTKDEVQRRRWTFHEAVVIVFRRYGLRPLGWALRRGWSYAMDHAQPRVGLPAGENIT
jgi:hypothetical protein